ncbi:toll/interleukin-1 receptor domain-containing protein [Liquorilactobacillus satsumensis]|uniref:toll/interleukin-1 receptor domain-containing protein n=1 Tax=Liquorilactobacillus satsumensis TaxID=259059 RepID=UPI0021C3879F|nr:toll/interleukin-1 receptor domain-containing protein [Liquorilactobacillus satsumensis]MCP9358777.1 toll/interleukin-1 receptor domain-containing protein [Liquorilactobacillus satsumensis]MCP9372715.1 toll/interleukin-1 receptor domain-containing protein [Liquorilactobacillus satsumensis]
MIKGFKIKESTISKNNWEATKDRSAIIENDDITGYISQNENGTPILDGERLINDWFPDDSDKNIFISHAHKDAQLVENFASFLENKGAKPFVDFEIWGRCTELIKKINNEFNTVCGEKNTYYYSDALSISANIYIILVTALNKMISQCSTFIFIESDNSIKDDYTYSPWIMEELNTFNILYCNNRIEKRYLESAAYTNFNVAVSFKINDIISNLKEIEKQEDFYKIVESGEVYGE